MSPAVVDLLRSATALQALTLQGPWGELVANAGKDVENRGWVPPKALVGKLLAIHQGLTYDVRGAQSVVDALGLRVPGRKSFKAGAVVAVTRLVRVVTDSPSDWAVPGKHHWCLEGTVALPTPVPCTGAQGVWQLPPAVLHQVREQVLNRDAQARAAVALSPTEGPPAGIERVAAEAWAATRGASPHARVSNRGKMAQCRKCRGWYKDYGEGPIVAHAPTLPTGTGPDWPKCKHGAAMYKDCMGDPCPPGCCQRAAGGGGAP
jgi:hypothetical protein